jgi:hypothetical protein
VLRVAITGHRDLDGPTTGKVDAVIRVLLGEAAQDLVGVSCLAAGTDQIFARAVLDLGGRLEVIIPSAGYAASFSDHAKRGFEELKSQAWRIRSLAHPSPGPGPYLDAGLQMLDGADRLIAVWDGQQARGRGGTAEIIGDARRRRMPVSIVWPDGSARTRPGTGAGIPTSKSGRHKTGGWSV